ncbi:IclR family transcriptional regulator [Phocoenobacter skyensis]|uniref:DNA-binding transcriptional regulator, IclR family n=1 Tax=Phocoenobacter skyensis TaxID=97481 RepID=A0A1H7UFW8_9PAST|nr:IclR family transcriptional regulator [Pasteurella skyensis]MDP8080044.1 IclR family transcriptional regulator [Pasteurella skyensis]MDP8086034.1 IclR family transcriptional regulator [Pasteurella skyensis]MDP8162584.1 IclR family transcriptional regulator [Pasteurella skyensis]MDP8169871.1 IclR family transcriptional regulator [Pasteurella skyensis]MDP8172818.1 IclR family transcriptional regulator [Pasteurella skyensis]
MSNQSLIRGLSLLDILSDYPNGCPLAKLAELSKLNKSTTHRMLQTLLKCGYIKPANTAGSYRLTTKCLMIGQKTLNSLNILNVVSPLLEQLNIEIGETVNFSIRDKHHAVMIYKLEPTTGMMKTRSYIGQQLQLYCSAMGKNFLAYDKKEKVEKYWEYNQSNIKQLTANTITSLDMMHKELENIRNLGFAIDNEENELGVTCIAFPIFDMQGKVKYSVSVSLSTARLKSLDEQYLLQQIKETAHNISSELGANLEH